MEEIVYNHRRPLSDFTEQIKKIKEKGFNVIGVSQIYFEDTFIFKTKKEAKKAYRTLERDEKEVIGWWYSKEDFEKSVEQ